MSNSEQKKSSFATVEEQMLDIWEKEKTFQNSLDNRKGAPSFSFYDGPPFANGLPHFGHSLVTSIKDSIGRYKTMRGYYVERRNGWDCHGLPVEFAIEKEFGVSGKKQILELGLDKFNNACRDSVFKYKQDWENFFKRIGRWTDTDRAYATIDKDYTESVWWVLKQLNDKGLLYKGYKSMPYCPRCETPLSNFELNEGYKENIDDPSLFVKFKLVNQNASLLGWTTTPWSLPGNAAIAVKPDEQYVYVKYVDDDSNEDNIILAKKRLSVLNEQNYTVYKEVNGSELVGEQYEPLFKIGNIGEVKNADKLYKVWPAGFVSIDEGTGILHVAPAFGEDDLNFGLANDLPVLQTVDASGHIKDCAGLKEVTGKFFKGADKPIIEHLTKIGRVFAAETLSHTYPFCYRCESPLLYYAISTWFVAVSKIKGEMLNTADTINWTPAHLKTGRFGKWLEGARDWAISRNRYWGAPIPIWVNDSDDNDYIIVGSIDELKKLAGERIDVEDLHRPYIDKVVIKKDDKTYHRAEEVLDCWFESGSMAVAQQHYPFENVEKFNTVFPADYVGEGLDQTRLWFYVLHVISTALFNKPAYKNVLVNGMIMAADGQKLSKRLKNYPAVDEVFAQEGADTLRLYLLSNYQAMGADYMRFNRDAMKDLSRNVLATIGNSYHFYKMYSDIDGWVPPKLIKEPKVSNILDVWMLSRVNQTIEEVTKQADAYNLAQAINPIFGLIDDMSNWFIRRSRRRFWKSDDDTDKTNAYVTLHFTLSRISQLMAPWAPFVADKLWRDLNSATSEPKSVHLSDWPKAGQVSKEVVDDMARAREYIVEGLSQRAAAKIKVRQPLGSVQIKSDSKLSDEFLVIVSEELNVKQVIYNNGGDNVVLDTTITESLMLEGLMRDIVRQIQESRKMAGLDVSDRIALTLSSTDDAINEAVKTFKDHIFAETLGISDSITGEPLFSKTVEIDGKDLTVALTKV